MRNLRALYQLIFSFSITYRLQISYIMNCDNLIDHWNIDQMINFDRWLNNRIYIFQILIIQLVPEVEHISLIVNFPTLQLISISALFIIKQIKTCIYRAVKTLSYNILTLLFARIAGISQCNQELKLMINFQKPLFTFDS